MSEIERLESDDLDFSGDLSTKAHKPFVLDLPKVPQSSPEASDFTAERMRLMRGWLGWDWEIRDAQ